MNATLVLPELDANSFWHDNWDGPSLLEVEASFQGDASDALALALQEKVAALLLLSQQEERHLLERNVNSALQRKTEELQRNLLQVTNEKVKALMELAQLKQEHQLLLDYRTTFHSYYDLEMIEFTLHEVLVASLSQVMTKSNAKGIQIVNDVAEQIMAETLYGDSLRLQQVLVDFLLVSIHFTPTGGQVVVAASLTKDQLGKSVHLVNLEFSITHDGIGLPEALLNQMFGRDGHESEEGISLLISRKLQKLVMVLVYVL